MDTGHPPCLFQALCTCSKPAGDLGIVTCSYVPILRVPATINSSKVFMLQLTGNKIRDLEPQFFQATGMQETKKIFFKYFLYPVIDTFKGNYTVLLIKYDVIQKLHSRFFKASY